MSLIKIIDNTLSPEENNKIQSMLFNHHFPWFYTPFKVGEHAQLDDPRYDYQFTHNFYENYCPRSSQFSLVDPILKILNPTSIVRIKANFLPVTEKKIVFAFHTDCDILCKTAIFYVNTNNGNTLFDNGEKIDSIENRLIIFNSNQLHTGTTCTDKSARCVINFNYF
jgi:hypothetical protein